jgi:hypothetical protein
MSQLSPNTQAFILFVTVFLLLLMAALFYRWLRKSAVRKFSVLKSWNDPRFSGFPRETHEVWQTFMVSGFWAEELCLADGQGRKIATIHLGLEINSPTYKKSFRFQYAGYSLRDGREVELVLPSGAPTAAQVREVRFANGAAFATLHYDEDLGFKASIEFDGRKIEIEKKNRDQYKNLAEQSMRLVEGNTDIGCFWAPAPWAKRSLVIFPKALPVEIKCLIVLYGLNCETPYTATMDGSGG